MAESSWLDSSPRNFVPGDIICNTEDQSHLRIVIVRLPKGAKNTLFIQFFSRKYPLEAS